MTNSLAVSEKLSSVIRTPENFSTWEPVPGPGIQRVMRIMQNGKMFRYGVDDPQQSEVFLLEQSFGAYMGTKYALGVNSCSSAILLSLHSCQTKPGDQIMLPGFTFTAVPSAVVNLGLTPLFVECDKNFRVDLDDLEEKARLGFAKIFLISHMRGHLSDMEKVVEICERNGVILIEDAAHALGSRWGGRLIGTFGHVGCFSAQSYKMLNGGEGGLITTNDEAFIVEAIYRSGAYEELGHKHGITSEYFETFRDKFAVNNLRMNEITGAIIRPQIDLIEGRAARYRLNYKILVGGLSMHPEIELPEVDPREERVPDSLQFRLPNFNRASIERLLQLVKSAGLPLSGFGVDKSNARHFRNWGYCGHQHLPKTEAALELTLDMRLPLALTLEDLHDSVEVILEAIEKAQ